VASPNTYPSGLNLAGTVFAGGPPLTALLGDYFSGKVLWLDTVAGSDANAGTLPQLPLKTIAQACTNSAAGDAIVISAGSAESPAVSQTFSNAGVTVIGMGTGATMPRYTAAYPGIDLFDVTAAAVRFYNIYFPASTAVPDARVRFGAAEGEVRNCYFECGASDTAGSILIHTSANSCRVRDTTLKSTASRPATAILVDAAVTDPYISGCIIDGGSFGWTDYAVKVSAAATRIRVENTSLLKQSNFGITITGTTYQLYGLTEDGSSKVVITA
jgi:hypothetical protein